MCKWNNTVPVTLYQTRRGSNFADVDKCIAPIVQALNDAGIMTIASCCGHGHITGSIILKDNTVLEIHPDFESWIEQQNKINNVNIHGEKSNG